MLNKTDLAIAVSEGIITSEQENQLNALSQRIHSHEENPLYQEYETRDEPFRLLRGFRDVFIALGIAFLSIGSTALYYLVTAKLLRYPAPTAVSTRGLTELAVEIGGAAVLLVLGFLIAEIVTRKLRLPLSSLILSLAVALWAGLLGIQSITPLSGMMGLSEPPLGTFPIIVFFFSAFIGIFVFYVRYRLPFVVIVIAGTLVGFSISIVLSIWTDPAKQDVRYLIGGLGFVVFLAAMSFDLQDRFRMTRLSENAFWLHLLAAPLMIHSIFGTSTPGQTSVPLILSVFTILTLVALIIDRRAFLVSSLIYMGGAFTAIARGLGLDASLQFAIPVFFIGVLVIVLGVDWTPLRRTTMSLMPDTIADRVPPIATTNQSL